jgi:hypothetical protein
MQVAAGRTNLLAGEWVHVISETYDVIINYLILCP